jgi:hypothetical protein
LSKHLRLTNKNDKPLGPVASKVVELRFEHPEWTQRQIAAQLNLKEYRVSEVLRSPRVQARYPILARQRLRNMVPQAVRRMGELMTQTENLEVSRKVTERVLDTEKVLENQPQIQVNVFQSLPESELKQLVDTQRIKDSAIDGEIIDEPSA